MKKKLQAKTKSKVELNTKVIAIAVAASVLLVAIWYLALYSSQGKSLKNAHSVAATANSQAAQLRSQIAVLQQEKEQLSASKAKLTTLQAALPNTPALDKLIDDINAAAASTGVDWQNVTPSKPASYTAGSAQAVSAGLPGGMQALSVAMQVNGAYSQVLAFVSKLTSLSRLLDVGQFNLSGIGTPKVSAQITSQIFYVPSATTSTTTG